MAKRINNVDELQIALMPEMKRMVDVLAERVYQTLNYFLQELQIMRMYENVKYLF